MFLRYGLLALVLAVGGGVARADTRGDSAGQTSGADATMIKLPPNAKLIGTSVVDEIRAFPEMKGALKSKPEAKVVGVEGVDRVFQSNKSFGDTVSFFDSQMKQTGYQILARVETPSSTAWTLKRPDGTVANVVVRNTSPTTFEIAEVNSAAAQIKVSP